MIPFLIRRSFYCLLVLLGVLVLTFALFNLAAGDPAAAVLGEHAHPDEVESLRREMGSDLPLFFGRECRTEAFPGFEGKAKEKTLKRNFPSEALLVRVLLDDGSVREETLRADTADFSVSAPEGRELRKIEFFRLQESPWNSQFSRALGELIRFKKRFPYVECFNFGNTVSTREPISDILKRGVVPSCMLMFPIFLGEMLFGIAFALVAVVFRNRWPDRLLSVAAVAGMSISYLVVIIFAQWFLGYYLEWFPVWGMAGPVSLGLPILVGVLCGIGSNMRFYRTVFVDELHREYLRTAVAKGAAPARVYGRHLLRNAAIQIVTRTSSTLPFLFTGSLLLESFFGIPGLGFVGVDALYNSDIQLLKALVIFSATLFVVINLLADLAYAWADPRIRLE